jgi:acyl carrier protein
MTTAIREGVRSQVRGVLETLTATRQIADHDDLIATGIVKSIHLMQLITALEDLFGFEIGQRDVHDGHLRSIERLVTFVLARQGVS